MYHLFLIKRQCARSTQPMRKEHVHMVLVNHIFFRISCHIHSTLWRGSICFLTCEDPFIFHWRNVCEAFRKYAFYVALPLYWVLFHVCVCYVLGFSFFISCIHCFFCIRKIQWEVCTRAQEDECTLGYHLGWHWSHDYNPHHDRLRR